MQVPSSPDKQAAGKNVVTAPMLERLGDYLVFHAAQHPDREATVIGDRRLSYITLHKAADHCAAALLANGVRRGDRIAVLTTPRPEYLIVFLALARIGAVWVGLNPRHRITELRYVVEDAKPVVLIGLTRFEGREFADDLERLQSAVSTIRRIIPLESIGRFLEEGASISAETFKAACAEVQGSDPLCIVHTSGTTGSPKGAVLTHRAFVLSYTTQYRYWPVQPLRILANLPVNHIGGLGDIGAYCLIGGGTQILMERFDARGAIAAIERERISVCIQMVAQYQKMATSPEFARADFSSLELAAWGDGPMPSPLVELLRTKARRVSTTYGLSEACGPLTFVEPSASTEVLSRTIGKPVREYAIRLADRSGRPVTVGEVGEIQVRGDFIMAGYYGRPEATEEVIDRDSWLHTGDLAVERADGNYELVGRLKEMYKSGGYNIYPREIELLLQSHPAIEIAAVIAVPDPIYQRVGHAFVMKRRGADLDEATVDEFCRLHLANYKVPKRIHLCDALPMLPNGKIDKALLLQYISK